MLLKVVIESNQYSVDIPPDMLAHGKSFFSKMDADMDKGWQMGREWVSAPNTVERCQIAADRLADAIESDNETFASLTAAYILSNMPGLKEVHINTDGEMQETVFL